MSDISDERDRQRELYGDANFENNFVILLGNRPEYDAKHWIKNLIAQSMPILANTDTPWDQRVRVQQNLNRIQHIVEAHLRPNLTDEEKIVLYKLLGAT